MGKSNKRIGNKFYTLFDLKAEGRISFLSGGKANLLFDIKKLALMSGNIHQKIAESFIDAAKSGTLILLKNHSLNYCKNGIYELSYESLNLLYKEMIKISEDDTMDSPEYLTFSFVEIERSQYNYINLSTELPENDKVLYIAISFQNKNKITIGDNNYFLINAVHGTSLNQARINSTDILRFQSEYVRNYLFDGNKDIILNEYFSYIEKGQRLGNTQNNCYCMRDIEDLLNENMESYKFDIYLSEITDVAQLLMVYPNVKVNYAVYDKHFKNRRKQLTLIITPVEKESKLVTEFYDMGSLYP